jgi:hypothetical protein
MSDAHRPPVDRARDLVDQSKLRIRRGEKRVEASAERVARGPHTWHLIALGRVCVICQTAQAKAEFDDDVPSKAG